MAEPINKPKINFSVQGEGRPVILVHGVAASQQVWANLIPELVNAGNRAYALDLLGHGDSHKPEDPRHYHVQQIYLALEEWIDSLNLAEPAVLIGHSLGGHLCLRHSLAHPECVSRMVLIDPYYSPQQVLSPARWAQSKAAIGAAALRRTAGPWFDQLVIWNPIVSKKLAMQHRRQMALDLRRASPLILHILPSVSDLTPRLPEIHTPTLVIWGSLDRTLVSSRFNKMIDLMPDARALKIDGTGHQPHLTTPGIVNSAILDFLKNPPA